MEPAAPPPRRGRDPASYISDADWDAIRNDRAFDDAAPETAASPPASEAPSSAIDLTGGRDWAEPNRRRSYDPPTFGVFFETRGLSDRDMRMREIVVDYFDQLQSAGLFYRNFQLGFDASGELIDPLLARRPEWNRTDQYQWAVWSNPPRLYTWCRATAISMGSLSWTHPMSSGSFPVGTTRPTITGLGDAIGFTEPFSMATRARA